MPTSVDLPLSNGSKRALAYAAEEAANFSHPHIGTEHLLLGLLRETDGLASQILTAVGMTLEQARMKIADWSPERDVLARPPIEIVQIHARPFPLLSIEGKVKQLMQFAWTRRDWKPMDILLDNEQGGICFDLTLRDDSRYEYVASGWTKEPCAICGWELNAEGGPEGSEAFTNGRQWLCAECYQRFVAKKISGVA
jgi:hypothetical protein